MYRIREVDAQDDDIADMLADLHRLTFLGSAPMPPFDWGHWWLAFCERLPVAFAGLVPSTHAENAGYFCRVGVLDRHWGHALQLRLMRAIESRARRNGWRWIISERTISPQPTTSSGPAIGFISPSIPGPGLAVLAKVGQGRGEQVIVQPQR
jgi:GNAT superfamily N-acetyltransferase